MQLLHQRRQLTPNREVMINAQRKSYKCISLFLPAGNAFCLLFPDLFFVRCNTRQDDNITGTDVQYDFCPALADAVHLFCLEKTFVASRRRSLVCSHGVSSRMVSAASDD